MRTHQNRLHRVDEDEEAAAATAAAADGTAGGAALAAQRAKRERSGGYNTRAHQQLLAQVRCGGGFSSLQHTDFCFV
jgi:hypothetical protein